MHTVLEILVPEQEGKLENMLYSVPDTDKMLDHLHIVVLQAGELRGRSLVC